jgi:hypothetical protein
MSAATGRSQAVSEDVEHKGFKIRVRQEGNRWIATIRKSDGSPLLVTLSGSSGPRLSLDTTPPTYSAGAAIKLAIDAIDGGNIR